MTGIKKAIAIIAMLATVTACFAGCSDGGSGTNSTASKSDSSTQSQAAEEEKEEKNEESEAKEEEKAPVADIPSDYELPATPEVIVYQGDKEVFHYAGETPSEVKSMLENMGIKDNGGYKVIKEGERLTVKVNGDDMEINVGKLSDDMRMVVDGMEINLDTMQAITSDGYAGTDTSTFKPDDFKTKQYATMQIITNSGTGNIVGCNVGIKNVPEN